MESQHFMSIFYWLDGTYYIGKILRKEVTCPKRQLPVLRNVLSSSSSRSSSHVESTHQKGSQDATAAAPNCYPTANAHGLMLH